jgi:hypothetical protein
MPDVNMIHNVPTGSGFLVRKESFSDFPLKDYPLNRGFSAFPYDGFHPERKQGFRIDDRRYTIVPKSIGSGLMGQAVENGICSIAESMGLHETFDQGDERPFNGKHNPLTKDKVLPI